MKKKNNSAPPVFICICICSNFIVCFSSVTSLCLFFLPGPCPVFFLLVTETADFNNHCTVIRPQSCESSVSHVLPCSVFCGRKVNIIHEPNWTQLNSKDLASIKKLFSCFLFPEKKSCDLRARLSVLFISVPVSVCWSLTIHALQVARFL